MYVVRIAYNSWSLQWLKTEFDTEVKRPYNFVMNCACDTKTSFEENLEFYRTLVIKGAYVEKSTK